MVKHTRKQTRVMTVCLANRARSPTAEWLLHRNYKVKSCGTAEFDATKPCDQYDMRWANKILVMEPYQKANLEARFPKETAGKVEVLDVPEVGKYGCQPSLLTEIQQRLEEHHLKTRDIRDTTRASNECNEWIWRSAERKMRGQKSLSYQIIDYWTPSQARDAWEGVDMFASPTTTEAPGQEWRAEEARAFARAADASRRRGGAIVPAQSEMEDTGGLRVWFGDRELTDAEIEKQFDAIAKQAREEEAREEQMSKKEATERGLLAGLQEPKRRTKQAKLMDELKKYAEDVKKFFES